MPVNRVTVVGIGADGWDGLCERARSAIRTASEVVGSPRQLELLGAAAAATPTRELPAPLQLLVDELKQRQDGACVLASGDPMLHGIGATLARDLGPDRIEVIPHVSAFALACARLRWPAAEVELVSVIAGPAEKVVRLLQPGRRLVVYASRTVPAAEVARAICEAGYGASRFVVLEQLGGPEERLTESTAREWGAREVDPLHAVAIEPRLDSGKLPLPLTPGIADEAFESDGALTKRHVRAITLASLQPLPRRVLWDVGAGTGSVALEWLRAEATTQAIAIEERADRSERIVRNARALGVPDRLTLVTGRAPEALAALPAPHAVFVGGGLAASGLLETCWDALEQGGVIAANAVTLEGEAALAAARALHGGSLTRIEIAQAEPVGSFTGWRPRRPVVHWVARK
jgi:precorrin-6Y C5,15-methyltransferase (decarboxylating)